MFNDDTYFFALVALVVCLLVVGYIAYTDLRYYRQGRKQRLAEQERFERNKRKRQEAEKRWSNPRNRDPHGILDLEERDALESAYYEESGVIKDNCEDRHTYRSDSGSSITVANVIKGSIPDSSSDRSSNGDSYSSSSSSDSGGGCGGGD